MPTGLRQRDPSGNILIDITTRLPRIEGRVNVTAGVSGSVAVPVSGTNPIFYYFAATSSSDLGQASPEISISGDSVVWTYANPRFTVGGILVYGRY